MSRIGRGKGDVADKPNYFRLFILPFPPLWDVSPFSALSVPDTSSRSFLAGWVRSRPEYRDVPLSVPRSIRSAFSRRKRFLTPLARSFLAGWVRLVVQNISNVPLSVLIRFIRSEALRPLGSWRLDFPNHDRLRFNPNSGDFPESNKHRLFIGPSAVNEDAITAFSSSTTAIAHC